LPIIQKDAISKDRKKYRLLVWVSDSNFLLNDKVHLTPTMQQSGYLLSPFFLYTYYYLLHTIFKINSNNIKFDWLRGYQRTVSFLSLAHAQHRQNAFTPNNFFLFLSNLRVTYHYKNINISINILVILLKVNCFETR